MKTTKLLLVMALAASFAACTKEVLVEPEKAIDSFDDVKGAKMIASGFAIDPNAEDAQTKIIVSGNQGRFSEGDVAGVAWFTNDKPNLPQTEVTINLLKPTVYANHKVIHDGDVFRSNSNVYEGWHVAYHAYQEMKRPSALTEIVVNPEMEMEMTAENYPMDRYLNTPMFSGAYFIGVDDVEDGVIKTSMPINFLANWVKPSFTLGEGFGETIKGLKVTSIELSSATGKELFLNTLSVNPAKLPEGEDGVLPTFTADNFKAYDGSKPTIAFYAPAYEKTVETILAEEIQDKYTLGAGVLNFRMFVAPVNPAVEVAMKDMSVRVNLENGSYFLIKGSSYAKATDSQNYKTFDKLVQCINGTLEGKPSMRDLFNGALTLPFELTTADYKTSYTVTKANSAESMNKNIALALEASATEVSFTFEKGAEVPFGDVVLPEGLKINCTSKGDGATFVISDDQTWNENIVLGANMHIAIEKTGNLTIEKNTKAATKTVPAHFPVANLTNKGILNVAEGVNIKATAIITNNVVNVGLTTTIEPVVSEGSVVYNVAGTETVVNITDLVSNTGLNSLIVNEVEEWALDGEAAWNVSVEMNKSTISAPALVTVAALNIKAGENTFTGKLKALVTVAAEAIATIDGTVTGDVTVNGNLTAKGKITGAVTVAEGAGLIAKDITKALTVKKGATVEVEGATVAVTVEDGAEVSVVGDVKGIVTLNEGAALEVDGNITKNVTVAKDATLTVTGDVTGNVTVAEGGSVALTNVSGTLTNSGVVTITSEEFVEIDSIINNGELTTEGANVYVYDITTKPGSTTTVDEEYAIYYITSYTNDGGTTIGKIVQTTGYENTADYKLAEGTYYVKTPGGLDTVFGLNKENYNISLESNVTVNAGATIGGTNAKSIMIDANGKTISFNQTSADWNPISTPDNAVLTITNGSIKATGTTAGNYYQHSLVFDCPVVMKDVVANTPVLVRYFGNKTCTFDHVTFEDKTLGTDKKGYYALWIEPYGQTVEVKDCVFNMINGTTGLGGRGIKVEQINAALAPIAGATLNISGTDFNTKAKAAVTVHCNKPVVINWLTGNNIDDVAEDNEHAVWIDSADITSDFVNNVTVNGHTKTIEGFNM